MNALIAQQSPKCSPYIGKTQMGVPISVAASILHEDVQSVLRRDVVMLEEAQGFLPLESKQVCPRFGVVWMSELQLRALAGFVSIIPRFASLPEFVRSPALAPVMHITPAMLKCAQPRPRARPPGYMVVLKELPERERKEARDVARCFNLAEVGLSLTSAVTVAALTAKVLNRPWHMKQSTTTLSVDGRYLAVGPTDADNRVTIGPVWPHECTPALEFIRE